MKKLFKKVTIVLVVLGMFVMTHFPNVGARYIGSLNGIWVNNSTPAYTGYLEKTVWNGWYVVNLSGTSSNSILQSQLVNSNDLKRSEWNYTRGGTRDNYYTIDCQAGYLYKLKLYNGKNTGADDVYGTWSPDHY